ncbi:MAG: hypothetical protein JST64_02925 [Actinobacteria bacterium]|nr:hypothetical protein [Actinomycetota bacterium]
MAAPKYVPTSPTGIVRSYHSSPRRPTPWMAGRPGELSGRQPLGEQLGDPGPDPGYALKLAASFRGQLTLHPDESEADALSGATAIAMKRAGLRGRAPVIHDVRVGLGIWGFLDDRPADELVQLRTEWFEEVHHPHHYPQRRRIADAAPDALLVLAHEEILRRHAEDWRGCLDLSV